MTATPVIPDLPDEFWRTARAIVQDEHPVFVDRDFPEQTAFIRDEARFKAKLCNRRAGKSTSDALDFLDDGWDHPKADYLYAALTLESAKKAIWRNGFKLINDRLGLGLHFNESRSEVVLPNQALVYIMGMDRPEMLPRARGGKYRKAVVDEAQEFSPDKLLSLCVEILRPALRDNRGSLTISGTPGPVRKGLFFDLTKDCDPSVPSVRVVRNMDTAAEWSVHCWSAQQNPYMRVQDAEDVAAMIAVNPRIVETPRFIRENLGRWAKSDEEEMVYRYNRDRNGWDGSLPTRTGKGVSLSPERWHHIIGIDLGYNDATAFTVCAWNDGLKTLFVRHAEKHVALIADGVADRIRALTALYHPERLVCDPASKQVVEDLKRRHGLPIWSAEKTDKAKHIDLMNADFIMGRIKVDEAACKTLVDEYDDIVWDAKALKDGKREEHPAAKNDQADSALYGWRYCYQYLGMEPVSVPKPGTPEWMAAEEERMWRTVERREERKDRAQKGDPWAEEEDGREDRWT